MNLAKLKKNGFTLKSNWQDLNSKSIFFNYTKNVNKFQLFEKKTIIKNCKYIVCDYKFKEQAKYKKNITYFFKKNINNFAIECSKIFFKYNIKIILVTGTNGKTSISFNAFKVLSKSSNNTAYIGTLGFYVKSRKIRNLQNTTPDFITLMNLIKESELQYKCKYIFIEASSIGFMEKRLGNLKADFGVLTNLKKDHLDYHGNIENYHISKINLLKTHIKNKSKILIQDDINSKYLNILSKKFKLINQGKFVYKNKINLIKEDEFNTKIYFDQKHIKTLSTINNFVIKNCISTFILLSFIKTNFKITDVFENNIPGRHQVIYKKNNKLVIVDYAHTPDGIKNLLFPYRKLNLYKIIIFGCGGDRDITKRKKIALVASKYTDFQIITDDNPRTENPDTIRKNLKKYCKNYLDIPSRLKAIKKGFNILSKKKGILFIVGKGHENIQIFKDNITKFSDIKESKKLARLFNK